MFSISQTVFLVAHLDYFICRFLQRLRANTRAFASQNSARKTRRRKEARETVTPKPNERPLGENDGLADNSPTGDDCVQENDNMSSFDKLGSKNTTSITIPSRGSVLQACTVTSGFIAALGVIIRQVHLIFFILQVM